MSGFFYVVEDDVRILFVDDDPILCEFAQVYLATASAKIDVAADGQAALDALAIGRYDLLLVDLEMPVMDGYDLLERLRADPATEHLPVIVQTGREDVDAIDRAYRVGATAFVTKPLNWRLLSYQIRFTLRATRAEAALRHRFSQAEAA